MQTICYFWYKVKGKVTKITNNIKDIYYFIKDNI